MLPYHAARTEPSACPADTETDPPLAWRLAIPLIGGVSIGLWVLIGKAVIAIAP